ncbi:MAG: DUF389 domain-containing protein [Paludibacteraceae bacterium]|nr:DUF389 domain-containing protein [Paludibacteraceae bacterium]
MFAIRELWRKIVHLVDLRDYIDVDVAAVNIRDNIAFRGPNIVILFCAIVIASVGLNVNSIPVIIGAMLISPLMSPIIGFGLALGTNDVDLLKHALKHLGIMVGISVLSATLYFLVSPLAMEHPTELLARTNPTIYDVLIALFGGMAGILEISRKEKGTVMAGVAIATALMPPLCTAGYGLATMNPTFLFGALYLFFINFTFIALAAYLGTKYLGYKMDDTGDEQKQIRRKWMFGILLIAIVVPSIISAVSVVKENNFTRSVNAFIVENKNFARSYIYDYKITDDTTPAMVDIYIAGEEPDSGAYNGLYLSAIEHGLKREQLRFHLDAAYQAQTALDENELVRDIFRTHEEQLRDRDEEIERLHRKVDSLSTNVQTELLPVADIEAEIRVQYPQITDIVLAQTAGTQVQVVALLTVNKHKGLKDDDLQRMEAWLKVRTGASEAVVIQREK